MDMMKSSALATTTTLSRSHDAVKIVKFLVTFALVDVILQGHPRSQMTLCVYRLHFTASEISLHICKISREWYHKISVTYFTANS